MNDSADYFESLELHAGEPETQAKLAVNAEGSDFIDSPRPEAENHQLAEGLEAMLHGDSLEHVVAEMGAACVTRSDVATAVHTAVTDAVQAAVNGVVAVAVAAAVKANSSMNADEVEKRFRQKYLGLGLPEVPGVDAPFLKAPRLQVEQDGSVALSPDAPTAVVELADDDTALIAQPLVAASFDDDAPDMEFVGATVLAAADEPVDEPKPTEQQAEILEPEMLEPEPVVEPEVIAEAASANEPEPETQSETPEPVAESGLAEIVAEAEPVGASEAVTEPESVVEPVTPVEEVAVETTEPVAKQPEPAIGPAAVETAVEPESVQSVATPPVAVEPKPAEAAPVSAETKPEPAATPPIAPAPEMQKSAVVVEDAVPPAVAEKRPDMPGLAQEPESVERTLRNEKSIQFVGFLVGTQMYAVPSILIREVIRRQPLSRLPVQTRFAPGVINLRGQVIPVVSLRELLQADTPPEGSRNQFSIITGTENLRIALEVDKIRSMYVVQQEDIVWNVGSVLGLDDDTVIGLFELEERLVPILSVERVAAILLEEGLDVEALSA